MRPSVAQRGHAGLGGVVSREVASVRPQRRRPGVDEPSLSHAKQQLVGLEVQETSVLHHAVGIRWPDAVEVDVFRRMLSHRRRDHPGSYPQMLWTRLRRKAAYLPG